jgi:hypothetical protein
VNEKKLVPDRFCTRCDAQIEKRIVDDVETHVCMHCQISERGYSEVERPLVKDLREYFWNPEKFYQIQPLLSIFQDHLNRRTP